MKFNEIEERVDIDVLRFTYHRPKHGEVIPLCVAIFRKKIGEEAIFINFLQPVLLYPGIEPL